MINLNATAVDIAPGICSLLSNISRFNNSLHELSLSSALQQNEGETYTFDEGLASRIHDRLRAEDIPFWKHQALLLVSRAVPWKYLEPVTPETKLLLPHLRHVLDAFQDDYDSLPVSPRSDLVLALIEAFRFPGMAWKRFAISKAELAAHGLGDARLDFAVGRSQCLLSRLVGNMNDATGRIAHLEPGQFGLAMDAQMHSALGLAIIQSALNCVQVEDLSSAVRLLEDWAPLGQKPSPLESVIAFRMHMLLGRVLRYQGRFKESLAHLETAQVIPRQAWSEDLDFDEDLHDLTCDHADTLRELDDPVSAEAKLSAEIERRGQQTLTLSNASLLELSLAEALFAQERFQEAERICLDVQSRPSLLKLEKLPLQIILAKIRSVRFENEIALSAWRQAMKEIGKFQLTNGRTTRIIALSIYDTLRNLGHTSLAGESLQQVAFLKII